MSVHPLRISHSLPFHGPPWHLPQFQSPGSATFPATASGVSSQPLRENYENRKEEEKQARRDFFSWFDKTDRMLMQKYNGCESNGDFLRYYASAEHAEFEEEQRKRREDFRKKFGKDIWSLNPKTKYMTQPNIWKKTKFENLLYKKLKFSIQLLSPLRKPPLLRYCPKLRAAALRIGNNAMPPWGQRFLLERKKSEK